jgi:hypothetical protein
MTVFAERWRFLPNDGGFYRTMAVFTERWRFLLNDGGLVETTAVWLDTVCRVPAVGVFATLHRVTSALWGAAPYAQGTDAP